MLKHPPLINVRHPFVQLLLVISMLIPSVFFFAYIGLFLVQPIYHVSPMDMINALSNPASFGSNQNYVAAAKLIQGLSELGFLAPAFLFAILMGYKNDYLNFNKTTYLIPVILAVAVIFLVQPFISYIQVFNEQFQFPPYLSKVGQWLRASQEKNNAITTVFMQMPDIKQFLINILVVAIIPGICEEALFRGTLQQLLGSWIKNKHIAVWITAFVFSASHGEFFSFVPLMILGALLGYLFLWSGNLWYSIIGHTFNNACAILLTFLYQSKIISFDPDNGIIPIWSVLTGTILTIGVLILYNVYFKHHPPGEDETVVQKNE